METTDSISIHQKRKETSAIKVEPNPIRPDTHFKLRWWPIWRPLVRDGDIHQLFTTPTKHPSSFCSSLNHYLSFIIPTDGKKLKTISPSHPKERTTAEGFRHRRAINILHDRMQIFSCIIDEICMH